MASIPLPALGVHAPQQPDLLEKYGQLLQLKNLQQQGQLQQQEAPLRLQALQQGVQTGDLDLQQKQIALKDQQAMTSAMQSWDGKDVNGLIPLVIKNGASAQAVMGLKSKVLEQQQTYSKIAADDATTGAKKLETMKGTNDMIAGALGNVLSMSDDQLPQGLVSTAQDLAQKGLIDPQHLQLAQQMAQSGDPAKIRQGVSLMQKGLLSESQQMENAAKQATAQKDQSQTDLNKMNLQRGGTTDMDKFTFDYLQAKGLENTPANRQKAFQEYTRETKIAPAEVRLQGLMAMPQAVADPNNPGQTVFVSRKDAIGQQAPNSGDVKSVQATQKFFSPAGKGGQNLAAFNTAQNHLQLLGQASEALGNGNVTMLNDIGQRYAKATGSAAPTNFDAVKNAVKGEVSRALTGNVTVSEQAELDKDFNNASSPKQIQGVIQKYTQLMQGKKDVLHQQYTDGMAGKVSFDDNSGGQASPIATHRYNPATGKIEAVK